MSALLGEATVFLFHCLSQPFHCFAWKVLTKDRCLQGARKQQQRWRRQRAAALAGPDVAAGRVLAG
eukprot:SAG22_NODE_115_length_19315_cov_10.458368_6_plen_66_part_00